MKSNQHTAEHTIKILEQAEKGEQTIASLRRDDGIAQNTFYRWRKAYGGMSVNEAQGLKELEKENARLKQLLAERMLENDLLKELLAKRADDRRAARSSAVLGGWRIVGAAGLCPGADPSLDLPLCRASE